MYDSGLWTFSEVGFSGCGRRLTVWFCKDANAVTRRCGAAVQAAATADRVPGSLARITGYKRLSATLRVVWTEADERLSTPAGLRSVAVLLDQPTSDRRQAQQLSVRSAHYAAGTAVNVYDCADILQQNAVMYHWLQRAENKTRLDEGSTATAAAAAWSLKLQRRRHVIGLQLTTSTAAWWR